MGFGRRGARGGPSGRGGRPRGGGNGAAARAAAATRRAVAVAPSVSRGQPSGAMKPPHPAAPLRVLFVCVGNSARSQMAEALLGVRGGGGYVPASGGPTPTGVHPLTARALAALGG